MLRVQIILLLLSLVFMLSLSTFKSSPEPLTSRLLLVVNKGEQTLGIVSPATDEQLAAVAEGGITGHEVAASPDGRIAYVPIYGNSGVGRPGTDGRNMVVIDIAARKVIGNVDFGHGVRPHCAVFEPNKGLLYVTTELDRTITVIDPETVEFAAGVSIHTVGATLLTRTVTVADPTSVYPSLSTAVTVMVCCPALRASVLIANEYPTLGHPGRPGNAPHTSGRLTP